MPRIVIAMLVMAACKPPEPQKDYFCPAKPAPIRCKECSVGMSYPRHMTMDALALTSEPVKVEGKFAYGTISKDLEDHRVDLWVTAGNCGIWDHHGKHVTDSDGRARATLRTLQALPLPGQTAATLIPVLQPGIYRYSWTVRGDGSSSDGHIFVIDPRRKVVVFDVDGTLTKSDGELITQFMWREDAAVLPGAQDIVKYWHSRGRQIVYVSGRHYSMHNETKAWLRKQGFPPGPLFTTNAWRESVPGDSYVGSFKQGLMHGWLTRGINIERAYGNARSDTCAYRRAGLDQGQVFIVDRDNSICDDGLKGINVPDYRRHVATLRKLERNI